MKIHAKKATPLLLAVLLTCVLGGMGSTAAQTDNTAPKLDAQEDQLVPVRRRLPGEAGAENRRKIKAAKLRAEQEMPLQHSDVPIPDVKDFEPPIAVPDRWRIVDSLYGESHWWDPYNRNLLKGDKPISGENTERQFLVLSGVSDTIVEVRTIPTPTGVQTSEDPDSLNIFGGTEQLQFIQQFALELSWLQGDTTFRPPDYEFRITPVFNVNYTKADELAVLNADPREGTTRRDGHVALQDAFFDYHLRNVSAQYDFDSIRVGIQRFNAGFRGFLFLDSALGVRLFGTRKNSVFSYNLAWFRRLEKDVNSGLNDISEAPRKDDVLLANLYWQDMPMLGYTTEFVAAYNRNREDDGVKYDDNGFIVRPSSLGTERPRRYDVAYLGLNGDGHFGRFNLSNSLYYAGGKVDNGIFTNQSSDINAWFAAAELSMDFDWQRYSVSFLYGSGDDDPFDDKSEGFDAILENPLFAGADSSYWIRQAVPFIGGGRVTLSGRNGLLNSLRSNKDLGQSNFTNPGIILVGAGADFDILPQLRVSVNANQLWFDETRVLEVARQQAQIDEDIGLDVSLALIYRPLMSQNIVLRASYSALVPGRGYEDLFPADNLPQSLFASLTLKY